MNISMNVDPTNESTIGILKGVAVILKYEPSATFRTFLGDTDRLYFGSYNNTIHKMTTEEPDLMDEWGWTDRYNLWSVRI